MLCTAHSLSFRLDGFHEFGALCSKAAHFFVYENEQRASRFLDPCALSHPCLKVNQFLFCHGSLSGIFLTARARTEGGRLGHRPRPANMGRFERINLVVLMFERNPVTNYFAAVAKSQKLRKELAELRDEVRAQRDRLRRLQKAAKKKAARLKTKIRNL
jgi:hypothetical protein